MELTTCSEVKRHAAQNVHKLRSAFATVSPWQLQQDYAYLSRSFSIETSAYNGAWWPVQSDPSKSNLKVRKQHKATSMPMPRGAFPTIPIRETGCSQCTCSRTTTCTDVLNASDLII